MPSLPSQLLLFTGCWLAAARLVRAQDPTDDVCYLCGGPATLPEPDRVFAATGETCGAVDTVASTLEPNSANCTNYTEPYFNECCAIEGGGDGGGVDGDGDNTAGLPDAPTAAPVAVSCYLCPGDDTVVLANAVVIPGRSTPLPCWELDASISYDSAAECEYAQNQFGGTCCGNIANSCLLTCPNGLHVGIATFDTEYANNVACWEAQLMYAERPDDGSTCSDLESGFEDTCCSSSDDQSPRTDICNVCGNNVVATVDYDVKVDTGSTTPLTCGQVQMEARYNTEQECRTVQAYFAPQCCSDDGDFQGLPDGTDSSTVPSDVPSDTPSDMPSIMPTVEGAPSSSNNDPSAAPNGGATSNSTSGPTGTSDRGETSTAAATLPPSGIGLMMGGFVAAHFISTLLV